MLAESEGSRALIDAENALSTPVLHMKLEQYRLDRLPEIMSHMMRPIEKIDSIRINHVSGFGASNGAGGSAGGLVQRRRRWWQTTRHAGHGQHFGHGLAIACAQEHWRPNRRRFVRVYRCGRGQAFARR
jgi:hypothetical protein